MFTWSTKSFHGSGLIFYCCLAFSPTRGVEIWRRKRCTSGGAVHRLDVHLDVHIEKRRTKTEETDATNCCGVKGVGGVHVHTYVALTGFAEHS